MPQWHKHSFLCIFYLVFLDAGGEALVEVGGREEGRGDEMGMEGGVVGVDHYSWRRGGWWWLVVVVVIGG
jgi:hypothetical protein